ncbi:TetR/AcrR family transcriptional regulator [Corynebacterium variabile]|uniref:TetR/AcrR family transcriptional regulator n=1 Tax=Corynebacterium variabile TaxID=1727 RepID=UPI002647EC6D|nr:TetR/AcrR family transcriptional regulator [Corynebacterium variabile]MDN6241681.1 TetR/AcrR family transcriptional regulator [Corynebacterium variabile]MDN6478327.1 TetR/AcrR family transcriptional regulator [Corynebacterium variabile]MDN6620131.1 TetR/AcrR family transcriptional regulator [Corynebacterium variabile]MDN6844807.1 TetR/AcrR family transcriptional regulator [Corynebacterium variabile]
MAHSPLPARSPRFTADDAVRSALSSGIADFTMSGVARSLGVTSPALYRRFPAREDLTAACLMAVGRGLPEPPGNMTWRECLDFLAESLWTTLLRYPGLDRVLSTFPRSLREALDPTGRMVSGLYRNGFTASQAIFATQYITDFATGTVAQCRRQIARNSDGSRARTLTEQFHLLYRRHISIMLDSLEALDPDFPEMVGPVGVPGPGDGAHP